MFESTEMGVTELVLFDGTPAAIDYVISSIDRKEIPSLLVCLYNNKRDTMMLLIRRLNDYLRENNRFPLHVQGKIMPVYYENYNTSDIGSNVGKMVKCLQEYLEDTPALANLNGVNGKPLPIIYPTTVAPTDLLFEAIQDSKPTKIHYEKLGLRNIDCKLYPSKSKLKFYEKTDSLVKASVKHLQNERNNHYQLKTA